MFARNKTCKIEDSVRITRSGFRDEFGLVSNTVAFSVTLFGTLILIVPSFIGFISSDDVTKTIEKYVEGYLSQSEIRIVIAVIALLIVLYSLARTYLKMKPRNKLARVIRDKISTVNGSIKPCSCKAGGRCKNRKYNQPLDELKDVQKEFGAKITDKFFNTLYDRVEKIVID